MQNVDLAWMGRRGRFRRLALAVALSALLVIANASTRPQTQPNVLAQSEGPLAQDTVRIEFAYRGNDPAGAAQAAEEFADLLSQETGLDVQASIFPCEGGVVEHLGSGRTDVAPLSAVAYVLGHDAYGIEARLVVERYGAPSYRGQINVQASGSYTDIWSLQGTRFAFSALDSWSGYYAPYLLISQTTGMTPTAFFGEVVFAGSHAQVIRDVYTGTAECGASYEGARFSVIGEYPDVLDVVEVLTYTESIYLEPWAFRQSLDASVVQALTNGIITIAETTEGDAALDTLIEAGVEGITVTQDSAYDFARDVVAEFGLQMETCHWVYLPVGLKNLGP